MRVRFIKCPTGKYNLCYDVGEEINLPDDQAMDMIEDGYAIIVPDKKENAMLKQVAETR